MNVKRIIYTLSSVVLGVALMACSENGEMSAEKLGKQIDKAAQDASAYTKEKMEQASEGADNIMSDAKEYTEEKVQEAGEAIEKTGKALQESNN